MDDNDGIPEYFRGKNIFITGGFGFMGKVLIEKLLRSCPDIGKLYVIARPMRGKTIEERTKKLFSGLLFDRIKVTKPGIIDEKVAIIEGDIIQKNVGLSKQDYEEVIQKVNVVVHLAASIKFDDPLEFALKVNVLGTKNVIDLSTQMKHFEVFVHVSTAYAHCILPEVEEVYYEPKIKWNKLIDIMENTDRATFEILSSKIRDEYPNTYVYTKSLAEDLVWDYRDKLPVVIMRPSIVVSCYREPIPGWTDNLYGPAGFMFGAVKGIIRVMYSDIEAYAAYVPADLAIKAIISATWYKHKCRDLDDEKHIYNVNHVVKKTNLEIWDDCNKYLEEYPLRYPIWHVNVTQTKSFYVFIILFYIMHLIPALVLDLALEICRQKPILFKLQKKYYKGMNLMSWFLLRVFSFRIDNLTKLDDVIPDKDKDDFALQFDKVDLDEYMVSGFIFGRTHILKDPPGEKYEYWYRAKALKLIDRVLTAAVLAIIGWITLRLFNSSGLTLPTLY